MILSEFQARIAERIAELEAERDSLARDYAEQTVLKELAIQDLARLSKELEQSRAERDRLKWQAAKDEGLMEAQDKAIEALQTTFTLAKPQRDRIAELEADLARAAEALKLARSDRDIVMRENARLQAELAKETMRENTQLAEALKQARADIGDLRDQNGILQREYDRVTEAADVIPNNDWRMSGKCGGCGRTIAGPNWPNYCSHCGKPLRRKT